MGNPQEPPLHMAVWRPDRSQPFLRWRRPRDPDPGSMVVMVAVPCGRRTRARNRGYES